MVELSRLDRVAALIRESQQARQDLRDAQEAAEAQMRRVQVETDGSRVTDAEPAKPRPAEKPSAP